MSLNHKYYCDKCKNKCFLVVKEEIENDKDFPICVKDGAEWKKEPEWSLHYHLSYVGSEYACDICNPVCHENHGVSKHEENFNGCSHPCCPARRKSE